jgi:hypothetical protein
MQQPRLPSPPPTYLQFQTPHYKFQMKITHGNHPYRTFHFLVGDSLKPCLEGFINLDNQSKNDRYNSQQYTAKLIEINALEECSVEDITSEYTEIHSFGKEMLDAVVFFVNSQFPQVKTMSLNDASFIPCNRKEEDTLDLLSYSIALYKKTWYEERLDAYILPKERHEEYRKQVEAYASKETKQTLTFDIFYTAVFNRHHIRQIVDNNYEIYRQMFDSSETIPEFFQKLSRTIPRKERCKFFKGWLMDYIFSKITVDRTWYFDLYPKIEVIQPSNMKPVVHHKTRRNKNRVPK